MKMDRHQQRIDAAFLSQCSSQAAYDWLFEHRHTDDKPPLWINEAHKILEYLLLRRNDQLIDLGIARYGYSNMAIQKVYRRGNVGVRCAALSNANIGPSGFISDGWLEKSDIKEIILKKQYAELEALVKNKFLDDEVLEHLIERKEEFSDLNDDQFTQVLVWLGSNQRMSTEYGSGLLDGWAEYSHGKVFSLAWDLARHLPTTKPNAYALYTLLQHTALPTGYDNPEEVLARWRLDDISRERGSSYFLRSRLADVMEANDYLLNADDRAMRESFYRRFLPWQYKDWPKFIDRDGEIAYEAIVGNDELWSSTEERNRLHDLSWNVPDPHSSMTAPNTYNAVEERKRRQHPEWFVEQDNEYSNDPNAIVRRLEKKMDKLVDAISILPSGDTHESSELKNVTERIDQLLERSEEEGIDNENELRQELQTLREEIFELIGTAYRSPCKYTGTVWPWVIVILLLILILLK